MMNKKKRKKNRNGNTETPYLAMPYAMSPVCLLCLLSICHGSMVLYETNHVDLRASSLSKMWSRIDGSEKIERKFNFCLDLRKFKTRVAPRNRYCVILGCGSSGFSSFFSVAVSCDHHATAYGG